ncbi:MAG: ABC transporter ATP-binding protein [Ignavibacteriae bacterium]|nr:ABC transporter ATP-binding protein [Ignavibacteriota bacterium]
MIEFKDVFLYYSGRQVLDGISMQIPDGKITAILGPSGSGKSTIIKLMLGLIQPTYGQVIVDGVDISRFSEEQLFPYRKKMGIVFQGNALFDSMTVGENMGFFLRENLDLPDEEVSRRVHDQLKFAGLETHEHHLPDSLSGGMRKRVAIGRALIFEPEMVLFDEPTAGLDPVSSNKILSFIKQLNNEKGLGAVMVTHIISDVFAAADVVLILYQGRIIFYDAPEKMKDSDHPFVQSFLRDPEEW